jgi:hypothetical protein
MENVVSSSRTENLHTIAIFTLPDKNQQRIACKALLDQCWPDTWFIYWELTKAFDLPDTSGNSRIFITAAGTFKMDKVLKLTNTMLPYLSMNCTFTLELVIISEEYSGDVTMEQLLGRIYESTQSWHKYARQHNLMGQTTNCNGPMWLLDWWMHLTTVKTVEQATYKTQDQRWWQCNQCNQRTQSCQLFKNWPWHHHKELHWSYNQKIDKIAFCAWAAQRLISWNANQMERLPGIHQNYRWSETDVV